MHHDVLLENRNFSDLNPLLLGWEDCKSAHSFGPYTREYYLIHYVVSGKGMFYTTHGDYPVGAGEFFLIRPHEITTYTADKDEPWTYIWVGFTGKLTSRLDSVSPVVPYPDSTFLSLLTAEEQSLKEEFVASKLFELFSIIFSEQQKSACYEKMAYNYISANYMHPIRIEEIASLLKINRQYLSRLFRNRYSVSMQEYLVSTRLSHAAALLKRGSNVSQTASMVGYEDAFNFSKAFKKKYKISPQQYRKTSL